MTATKPTISVKDAAATFLQSRRIAVTGVSRTPQDHGANVVYKRLRDRGYEVFAVNPNTDTVEGDQAYASLADIAGGVDAVVIATRPDRAEATVEECERLGIDQVWMHRSFGGGSVCDAATVAGRDHGMTVIDGGCPLMFDPVADPGHKMMRLFLTATARAPAGVTVTVVRDDHDRAGRVLGALLADRPEEQAREPAPAPGADDEEVGMELPGRLEEGACRVAAPDVLLDGHLVAWRRGVRSRRFAHDGLQVGDRGPFDLGDVERKSGHGGRLAHVGQVPHVHGIDGGAAPASPHPRPIAALSPRCGRVVDADHDPLPGHLGPPR